MHKTALALALGALASTAAAQCINPTGTLLADFTAPGDFITGATPIGFAFPFNGTTYTDIHVSDHGLCFLSNGGVPAPPVATPFVYDVLLSTFTANGPVIAPFWSDHTLGSAGEIWIDNTSGTTCTITWKDAQTFFALLPAFSFQMTLTIAGDITFSYDSNVDNYGSTFAPNAIIGASEGGGAALAGSVDLTSGPVSPTTTMYEEFGVPGTADVAGLSLNLIPTNPGWVVVNSVGACASHQTYGIGCYNAVDTYHETFIAGGVDITSGTTITMLRQAGGYTVLDAIPGAILPPSPGAINIAPGLLDGEQTVTLSGAMPVPGGTTTDLVICTKGYVTLGSVSNGIDFTPSVAEFEAFAFPAVAPMWHDWNQAATGSGLILYEEVGGIAYATWDGVYSFTGASVPTTFQMQFNVATGDITIVYGAIGNDGPDYLLGFTSGNSTFSLGIDITNDLAGSLTLTDVGNAPLALDSDDPVLGGSWDLTTTNIDPISPIAITFFGTVQVNPGLGLGFLGAGGCNAYIQPIVGDLTGISVGGTATVSLPIPANPTLTGATVTAQSVCLTLANSLNLLTSNGVLGTLGN